MTWRTAVTILFLLFGASCSSSDGGYATEASTTTEAEATTTEAETERLEAMFTSQGYTADEAVCMVGSMQAQVDAGDVVDDRTMIATAVGDCGISDERIAELQAGAQTGSVEDRWASALESAGLTAEEARCAASEFVARYGETTDVPPGFDGDALAAACGFDPAILNS